MAAFLANPPEVALAIWIVWYATWIAAVVFSGRTRVQMKTDAVGVHRFLAGMGAMLLFAPAGGWGARWTISRLWLGPLWLAPLALQWLLVGAVVAGFAFCWWARLHLGRLWSGLVTLKEDHRIIDTGPYALVRHPIYTGVMVSALMMAILEASPVAFIGFAMVTLGFAMTAGIEERFLRAQLGAQAYDAYAARVGMLVPRLRL